MGDSTTLGSYISDDQDIAARVTDHLALQWARAELTPGEQKVLVRRYEDECTQTEIADRLGLSQMQVSRIIRRILDHTRRLLEKAAALAADRHAAGRSQIRGGRRARFSTSARDGCRFTYRGTPGAVQRMYRAHVWPTR